MLDEDLDTPAVLGLLRELTRAGDPGALAVPRHLGLRVVEASEDGPVAELFRLGQRAGVGHLSVVEPNVIAQSDFSVTPATASSGHCGPRLEPQ